MLRCLDSFGEHGLKVATSAGHGKLQEVEVSPLEATRNSQICDFARFFHLAGQLFPACDISVIL